MGERESEKGWETVGETAAVCMMEISDRQVRGGKTVLSRTLGPQRDGEAHCSRTVTRGHVKGEGEEGEEGEDGGGGREHSNQIIALWRIFSILNH